jgi:hypothetical protein
VYQEVDGFEDGQIVAEVEKGYLLGERVLRPSMVVVAKAPAKSQADDEKSVDSKDKMVEGEVISSETVEAEPDPETDSAS